jgi:iron complex transport system substrate-binding protein
VESSGVSRIVSLLPSATEIVCALGLRPKLVGISHECDFPADVVGLPVLTEPKIAVDGASAEIHDAVEHIVREGVSVYRLRIEILRDLRPDLIVTQDHCEVCAVSLEDVSHAVTRVLAQPVHIVSLRPTRLGDLWTEIARVAAAAGAPAAAPPVVAGLRARLEALAARARGASHRPRVAFIEWMEPLMLGGNWVPDLVSLAGGSDEGPVPPGAHSAWIDWPALARYRPEVIVISPCGFSLSQTRRDLPRLTSHPEWHTLPAVSAGRVFVVDGSTYFNRPGPRLVESAEILAHLLHPEVFAAPHDGWVRLADEAATRTS